MLKNLVCITFLTTFVLINNKEKKMKRKDNTIAIKAKYIPFTGNREHCIKFTQTNTNKSVCKPINDTITPIEQMCEFFENNDKVISYQMLIDNTQNQYYIFVVEFEGSLIPNLLN
jgi:hypothetical protein